MKRRRLAVALVALGCSPRLPWLRGDLVNHPAILVGEWVDVEKTSPNDSSLWILSPDGDDHGMRITRDRPGAPRLVARQYYGYWYVRRRGDGAEELCVTRRPSRDAPSCTSFQATIDSSVTPVRRMVRLRAYAGAHHTGARLLVERG